MKIVFIAYLHGFGGAEKQVILLANAMVERGHDVTLISISADNNCYALDDRVKYVFLPDRMKNVLRIATRYYDIKHQLNNIKPDMTVSYWFQSAYMTAIMHKSITGKVVYSERGDPGDKEYNGLLGLIRKITLHRIDGFVFQSQGAKSYFDIRVQQRSVIIPNPVSLKAENFPPVTARRKVIVTVGRLHPQKNQKLLIDAFAIIANKIPDYNLEIYGDGELEEEILKQIEKLGLETRVFLKGTSKEIHRLIYDASLFVLSSDYEGLPNTLLEAMALGIPCISTDCRPGGAREIIEDGVDGLITPVGNKTELARAIEQSLINYGDTLKRSSMAMKKMNKYKNDVIYSQWEEFLGSVMNSNS